MQILVEEKYTARKDHYREHEARSEDRVQGQEDEHLCLKTGKNVVLKEG